MVVRILAVAIFILGLVGIVFGAMFFPQAASGRSEVENAVSPIPISQINDKYDDVFAKYKQMQATIEPAITAIGAGKATDADKATYTQYIDTYNYLGQHFALLGLAKANIGQINFVMYMGIVCICLGVGLSAGGYLLLRKA
jgi:hypothetical protein